ncbi:hypothetical protein FH972_022449 [Carpinus fangiana]|uniref:Uncharacterized protein n=1 Tax=Carpinus fangiana TaxID=176857 RepID=A0A5N6KSU4_9ROSI|nr:hypothetical protein FH972_022449 [Carpinus fangiana]
MYVPAMPITPQLVEHIIIYFEEQLFVSQHGAPIRGHESFAYLPSAHIIGLVATLTVHPSLTTRAPTTDGNSVPIQSLGLLDHINQIVGPVGASLDQAFQFTQQTGSRGKRKLNKRQLAKAAADSGDNTSDTDHYGETVNSDLANDGALFAKAEDFWHLVGWSFNCSVKHHNRWAWWRLWLSFHLTVLEDDFMSRLASFEARPDQEEDKHTIIANCMMMQYLQAIGKGASRTARRRAMRSIFARADEKDLAEFPEVFKNELKERKLEPTERDVRPRKRVHLDEGDFGDYFDEDDDEGTAIVKQEDEAEEREASEATKPLPRNRKTASPIKKDVTGQPSSLNGNSSPVDAWGGAEAIALRHRLLVLLAKVSTHLPGHFMYIGELLDICTEFIRPLPVSIFAIFTSPTPVAPLVSSLPSEQYVSLLQMLLQALVGTSKAPKVRLLEIPSQEEIQQYYLPCAASSVTPADNARVSLILEGLLRLLWKDANRLQAGKGFKADLEWGIEVRRAKATNMFSTAKKIRIREEDDEANSWLAGSEVRMTLIAASVEGQLAGG